MSNEHRKDSRHDKFLIAEYKQKGNRGGYSLGTVRNLSPEGFSLESQVFQFERGEVLDFRLTRSRAAPAVIATGEVVWKKQSWYKYISGIRFINATEDTRSGITALMTAAGEDWNDTGAADEPPENVLPELSEDLLPPLNEGIPGMPSPDPPETPGREDRALSQPFLVKENENKQKSIRYAALAAVVIVLFLVLPAAVKRLATSPDSSLGALPDEASVQLPDNTNAVDTVPPGGRTGRDSSRTQDSQALRGGEVRQERKGLDEGTPKSKDLKELIARIDRTLASAREIEEEKRRKGNAPHSEVRSSGEGAGFSENWVRVGSVNDGIPLFIETSHMSNPSEHIVKLMVRTVDEEREFIDLVEIDCARSVLRVIDRLNIDNPATVSYSGEWRPVLPESMVLRDAACFVSD